MKSRLTIFAVIALMFSACTTGMYVTRTYTDDIYFNPGDVPPPIAVDDAVADNEPLRKKSGERLIISQIEENQDGSNTMNNYIFDGTDKDVNALSYNMNQMEMYESDTTVYYNDDEVKYVINNYYDGNNLDYAYRIRRFHNPFFYDPFYWDSWYYDPFYYSSWYSPYWSMGWGYSSWYSPYYSWGWGYSPYYSYWNRPYYSYYGYGYPYYSWYGYGGYYGNIGYHDYANSHYGKRRSTGTNVVYGENAARRNTSSMVAGTNGRNKSGVNGNTDENLNLPSRRNNSTSGVSNNGVTGRSTSTTKSGSIDNNVLTERRRTSDNSGTTLNPAVL
jgi:hypothetical protein